MFLKMQIYSVVFAKSTNKQPKKYAKTFKFLCAGVKDFVKYQAQGGGINSNSKDLTLIQVYRPCHLTNPSNRILVAI